MCNLKAEFSYNDDTVAIKAIIEAIQEVYILHVIIGVGRIKYIMLIKNNYFFI